MHTLFSTLLNTWGEPSAGLWTSPWCSLSLLPQYSVLQTLAIQVTSKSQPVSSNQSVHQAPPGFSLPVPWPENFLLAVSWGNYRALFSISQRTLSFIDWCLIPWKLLFHIYFFHFLSCLRQKGKFIPSWWKPDKLGFYCYVNILKLKSYKPLIHITLIQLKSLKILQINYHQIQKWINNINFRWLMMWFGLNKA